MVLKAVYSQRFRASGTGSFTVCSYSWAVARGASLWVCENLREFVDGKLCCGNGILSGIAQPLAEGAFVDGVFWNMQLLCFLVYAKNPVHFHFGNTVCFWNACNLCLTIDHSGVNGCNPGSLSGDSDRSRSSQSEAVLPLQVLCLKV